jgi:hypothetical protein
MPTQNLTKLLENKRICNECVGEQYLKQEVNGTGVAAECSYCGNTRVTQPVTHTDLTL